MKKFVKIMVSLLLVMAIFVSIGWYLLEYDPEFTRDFLLQQARYFEQQGRNSIAVWLYNLAYHQADKDDSVAIELAEYYKSIGNYSKAEYTLSQAIEDGGSIELYIALCKTFVEQDKLRDAVIMLDHVSAPEIKAQLDAMRPQAPQATHTSGHYSQYITVDFTSENAAVYAATDKDYPSVKTDAFTAPCTLSRGETTFCAVAVSENGLVSPMAEYQYHVDGVVETVEFADSAFADAIRDTLGIGDSVPIYSDALWSITQFQVPSSAITCEDLAWLPNLTELTIHGCAFSDMQILGQMSHLQTLTVTDSVISADDLLAIAQLPQLRTLTLSGCYLSSITNLASATGLTYLDLSRNSIRDLSALSGMTALETLILNQNALISLDALTPLTALTELDVSYNSLVTTAPLVNLTNLRKLNISGNNLMQVDVTGIDQLSALTWFAAADNQLVNVDFLENCTGLKTLLISNNTILDISVLANLTQLEHLDFSYNEVEKLPTFTADCPLHTISGGHNLLKSLDPLAVLQNLQFVYMDYNQDIKKIDALVSCASLQLVNVYATSVRNADKLIDKGVTVNYTPV